MADISITGTNVLAQGGSRSVNGVAGATIAAGEVAYLDPTTSTYKLADTDSATAAARSPTGFALNGAAANQPLKIHREGPLAVGSVLTAGVAYYLSGTPGKICPVADVAAGDYPCIIGIAKSATVLDVKIHEAGVVLA